jgi:hypothetical protein
MTVWIVTVEQHYAGSFRVVGVYADKASADYIAKLHLDAEVNDYVVESVAGLDN